MAEQLTGDLSRVHVGYTSLDGGFPTYLPHSFGNVIKFDPSDVRDLGTIHQYIKQNNIEIAFGFDQPVESMSYKVMKRAGVKLIIAYWGAPMSSINRGVKLMLKRLQVRLTRYKPDHYIFQSKAMADSAVFGRGISAENVSVIHNAVDTNVYKPDVHLWNYAYHRFKIPTDRKILFYSGHMEERKGVQVIIKCAKELVEARNRKDVHFLILGNVSGQEKRFESLYLGTKAEGFITFGGYRNDVSHIHSSCYAGVIASTGWDSFTMSSMEMASSGLPLVVSDLQGLKETVEPGSTGFLVTPGDHMALADKIEVLLDDKELRDRMGRAARQRVVESFSLEQHISKLTDTVKRLYAEAIV
ncbi:glycosyltransferase family 4 protein [Geomonas anaerohicana]|uniref:Glycosyltransferase family 4 protein n=1 Tax=Geomonas anaerohicana TaxID=2798583 RepID=A0ABS0YC25_9BACT|nr:glycosyltransferase family 4 protein [Geomonas anaerohicana]MBJ6749825.1 glycosyltransferase family 4 protein [Geomonas anaerohicana]